MTSSIQQRRKQLALTSATGLLLTGLALVLLNILATWFFLRWDLTERKAYSLSPSSKRLVRTLEDVVVIKAYFTPDLPAPYNAYARYVKDILMEYRAASKGRVRFEFVSPIPQPTFEQRAMEAGLMPIQFEELGSSQLQIRRGFMGLILYYRDHSEVLPVVKNIQGLEYDITSRIARMAQKNKKVIALSTGHAETNWRTPQFKLSQDLEQLYEFRLVTLPPATTAPLEADLLLVVGPQQKFDEKSLWAIDQAIMRGTPTAFLVDAKRFMLSQFTVMAQTTGLEDLLKAYGVQLGDRLVYDAQCETVGMTQNVGGLSFTTSVRYPYIPLVTHFEKDHPILRGIETIGMPFCVLIDPVKTMPSGVRFMPLFWSSARSWIAPPSTYSVSPNNIPQPLPQETHGPYALGGVLEGTFPSYFAGKKPPVAGMTAVATSPKTSIFVLGTSHILDPNLPSFPGTEALLTNTMAYLSHDETLLGIRSKGEILRPLKPVSGPLRETVKIGSILGIPTLAVLGGLWRWRQRESWKKTLSMGFAPAPAK